MSRKEMIGVSRCGPAFGLISSLFIIGNAIEPLRTALIACVMFGGVGVAKVLRSYPRDSLKRLASKH